MPSQVKYKKAAQQQFNTIFIQLFHGLSVGPSLSWGGRAEVPTTHPKHSHVGTPIVCHTFGSLSLTPHQQKLTKAQPALSGAFFHFFPCQIPLYHPAPQCCACSGVPPSLQQMEPLHLQQAWLDKGRHRGVLFPTVLFYPCGPVARRGALQAQKSASALQCFSTASCCLALLATASE